MGISAQQMLQNDPEYLARQLAQQEIGRFQNLQNPQIGVAGMSGALLGRGIANLFGGRGFFEVQDPALRKVAETQRVFNDAMASFDPANPAASYEAMAKQFSQMGYGQQAMMAAQEAAKYRQQERTEARQAKEISLRERQVLLEEVNKDPYGSIAKALQMPEDDPARATILAGASARIGEKNFDQAVKQQQMATSKAQEDAARAQLTRAAGGEVSEGIVTEDGRALQKRDGKLFTLDGRPYTGPIKRLAAPGQYDAILGGGAGTGTGAAAKPVTPEDAAKAALERRRKTEQATQAGQAGRGETEVTIGWDGQPEYRAIRPPTLTAADRAKLTVKELQEYNRSGKVPADLFER